MFFGACLLLIYGFIKNLQFPFTSTSLTIAPPEISKEKIAMEKKLDKIDNSLDKLERFVDNSIEFTKDHRKFLVGTFGALVLSYGTFFPNSVLVIQALSNTGFPELISNLKQLRKTYKDTRKTLKDELPEIVYDTRDSLRRLKEKKKKLSLELAEIHQQFKAKKISFSKFNRDCKEVNSLLLAVVAEKQKLLAVSSSFYKVYHAVNPLQLTVTNTLILFNCIPFVLYTLIRFIYIFCIMFFSTILKKIIINHF
jgi:hypothetical protein